MRGPGVGLEVVENNSPQLSGRQIGVGQSFCQVMGFLDKGRDTARKAWLHFAQHLAVFLKFSKAVG